MQRIFYRSQTRVFWWAVTKRFCKMSAPYIHLNDIHTKPSTTSINPIRVAAGLVSLALVGASRHIFSAIRYGRNSLQVFSSVHSGSHSERQFTPKDGMDKVLVRPGPPVQFLTPGMRAPACLFLYAEGAHFSKQALAIAQLAQSEEDAWLYGASHPNGAALATPTGQPADAIKGKLCCFAASTFREQLDKADSLYDYQTDGSQGTGSRSIASIVREDGSHKEAYWYYMEPSQKGEKRHMHVAVIGAGWGGWGAAKTLLEMGVSVTLLDAGPDPTGEHPMTTKTGKRVEAGIKGFWKDYPNIEALVSFLGLREEDVFTPCTNSSFYSPFGLEATAPIFANTPRLPSPLGQVVASVKLFERLPIADRVTFLSMLQAFLDFDRDEATFNKYDRMSAHELFHSYGVSKRLVDDFLKPTLLVGLFKPPEELSAAVTLELLYFYSFAHQDSFDVKWIKKGSIAESIIFPLAERMRADHPGAFTVHGSARVTAIDIANNVGGPARVTHVQWQQHSPNGQVTNQKIAVDGAVLAVGSKGLKNILQGSPELAAASEELSRAASLGNVDCISVRLWLDRTVPTRSPANVFSRFKELRGAGGTFFMLDQLQSDQDVLWGGAYQGVDDKIVLGRKPKRGSVVACDFYNSGALMSLSDDALVEILMEKLLPSAVPAFAEAKLVESHVLRAPGAVTWFSPGSAANRPPLEVSAVSNLVCAGDWVKLGRYETKAKGLCQERAYISGIEAANAMARHLGVMREQGGGFAQAKVLEIRADEPQVVFGRKVNEQIMSVLRHFGKDSWTRTKDEEEDDDEEEKEEEEDEVTVEEEEKQLGPAGSAARVVTWLWCPQHPATVAYTGTGPCAAKRTLSG
eukprot:g1949.t1